MLAGAAVAVVLFLVASGDEKHVEAAFPPGQGGKIVFQKSQAGSYDIWVMDPDGSDQVNLTADQAEDAYYPSWSPDGTKIAYEVDVYDDGSDYDIWVMNADGSGKDGIAEAETLEGGPKWSPDGTKIAFHDGEDVWVMDSDGSDRDRLTDDPAFDCCADWSPDGSRIVFDSERSGDRVQWIMTADGSNPSMVPESVESDLGYRFSPDGQELVFYHHGDIYTMNVAGTERQQITDNDMNEHAPTWSADGTRIIFTREISESGQIFSMNPDGSDLVNLSNSAGYDGNPEQQRIAGTPGAWGDHNCSGAVDAVDGLLNLRFDAGLSANTGACPVFGESLPAGGPSLTWGDVDCDGAIGPVDALKLLRHDAGLSVQQEEGCPEIGASP